MSERVTETVAPEQPEQKIETRTDVERIPGLTIGARAVAVLAVLVATAVYAQDKYSLKSPGGIACHTAVKAKDYIFHPYQKR